MGDKVVNQEAWINKQPYVGVMFKSQNNTTWTEDQESDIKFTINTAKFNTETSGKAVFKGGAIKPVSLDNNPISSTNGNNTLSVNIRNHGLIVGSYFNISGVDVGPGINVSEINKQHVVTEVVSPDKVKFLVTANANATTDFGGAAVLADYNVQFSTFHAVVAEMLFRNTELNWGVKGWTGKSYDGLETPYLPQSEFIVQPNTDVNITNPLLVGNVTESNNNVQGNTIDLNGNMITYQDNISPVIDVNRIGMIAINNRINYPEVLNENDPTGGNVFNRYITNVLRLKNAAESLKVYADVYQPTDTKVVLYYRIGNSESEVLGSDWVELPNIMSQFATGINTHIEFEWGKDEITPFTFYQFKYVLLSKSNAVIPTVKRLRGIALGT